MSIRFKGKTIATGDTAFTISDIVTQVENGVKDIEDKRVKSLDSLNIKTNDGLTALANASNALRQTQITNCLLEVPQRLNYTLSDGKLTLKAGSVVIVPYGTENLTTTYPIGSTFINSNFKVVDSVFSDSKFTLWVELQTDLVGGYTGYTFTGTATVDFTKNNIMIDGTTTDPTATGNFIYFDTTTYKVTQSGTTGDTTRVLSLPIAIAYMSAANGVEYLKQVFNGFGYMGYVFWVDKGVKGLAPNGRNTDGALKNSAWEYKSVYVRDLSNSGNAIYKFGLNGNSSSGLNTTYHYDEIENMQYNGASKWIYTYAFDLTKEATGITSLKPKLSVRAVDYNDFNTFKTEVSTDITNFNTFKDEVSTDIRNLENITVLKSSLSEVQVVIETYKNGNSWYRVWSDGWCEQGGALSWDGSWITVALLKPYANVNYTVLGGGYRTDSANYQCMINFKDWTVNNFKMWASDDTSNNAATCKWYACGYIS